MPEPDTPSRCEKIFDRGRGEAQLNLRDELAAHIGEIAFNAPSAIGRDCEIPSARWQTSDAELCGHGICQDVPREQGAGASPVVHAKTSQIVQTASVGMLRGDRP